MNTHQISARRKRGNWIDGTIGSWRFQAKIYDIGSKYGIDNGRASKLFVWDAAIGFSSCIISYERGWDRMPEGDEQKELLRALLQYLEALPMSST